MKARIWPTQLPELPCFQKVPARLTANEGENTPPLPVLINAGFAETGCSYTFCHPSCAMLLFCERTISVSRSKYLPSHNRGIPVPKKPKTIGEFLRKRRLELGLRQSEAARRLGISTVTLSRWECDKVYPTWTQQPGVVTYLGPDPFINPVLGSPKSNETKAVAFLTSPPQTLARRSSTTASKRGQHANRSPKKSV
jgi:hypothetical protein